MTKLSYWQFFRILFTVFCLYLMGDAFYRWDGFKYYGTLSEFLMSVALAGVLLSIVTLIVAFLAWLPFVSLEWLSIKKGMHRQKELFFLFVPVFLLLTIALWFGKRLIFPVVSTSFTVKIAALLFVLSMAGLLTWIMKDRSVQWAEQLTKFINIIQNRITPLVWLFGIFVFFSVPLVIYQTWIKGADREISKETSRPLATDDDRPNFIFVTFDAMSARNMSLYGYQRPTTPFISEWAKKATVFTEARADSNFTAPTTSSLITGKRVWTHLRFSRMRGSPPIKASTESLPVLLKQNGYYNMAFIVNNIASVDNLGVAESFDVAPFSTEFMIARDLVRMIHKAISPVFYNKFKIDNWFFQEGFITARLIDRLSTDYGETDYPPELAFNRLIDTIGNGVRPFFAWVHLNPPHAPYLPPEPYKGMFDNSGKMRTIKRQLNERNALLAYESVHKQFPPEIETLRARYDEYIRYCDNQFEEFIARLEKEGKLKNTVVIFSTDHGEIFDHNNILHGNTLYEPETHIPLIIKEPGQSEGRVADDLVVHIDIPATILDLAGISVPHWMEGRSLKPLMRGQEIAPVPVFSMNLEASASRKRQITKGTIAVWDGDYKMIHTLRKNESLLFNLKKDPDEQNNLINTEPETGRRLLSLILDNLALANERISRDN